MVEAEGRSVVHHVEQLRLLRAGTSAVHREWLSTNPDFARRSASKLLRLSTRFRGDARFATFGGANLNNLGSITIVPYAPNLTAAEIGSIVAAFESPQIVVTPFVTPEASSTVLRLRTESLHCIEETDELSSSDEIVWSATWVTPTGSTGYRLRRTDFDKGETKLIADVMSFAIPQKFPSKYSFIFSMLEEDQSNAAKVVEQTWAKLKGAVEAKIGEFARWLAGQIGMPEIGPIISGDPQLGGQRRDRLAHLDLRADPMGTRTWTLNLGGGTKWNSTGNSILPVTLNHSGSGGRYTASLQFELA